MTAYKFSTELKVRESRAGIKIKAWTSAKAKDMIPADRCKLLYVHKENPHKSARKLKLGPENNRIMLLKRAFLHEHLLLRLKLPERSSREC